MEYLIRNKFGKAFMYRITIASILERQNNSEKFRI